MTVKELFDAIPISCDPLIWVSEDDGCDALVTANPELLEFLNYQDLGYFDDIPGVMYSVLHYIFGYRARSDVYLDCIRTDEGFINNLKLDRDTFYSCLKIVDIEAYDRGDLVLQCEYIGNRHLRLYDNSITFTR